MADVGLDHPIHGARREACREHEEESPVAAHQGEDQQRDGHVDRVGGPHPRHERGSRGDTPQGRSGGTFLPDPQEAARADQGADRDPVVGHGLRAVEEGHPQGGEQGAADNQDAGREQAPPGAQGQVESEAGQQGEVDTQQRDGRRPGRDRGHEQ